jgi:hypothetical protein
MHDDEKQVAAEAALPLIRSGMRDGLSTGTTVGHLLPLLPGHAREVTYVASSPRTEEAAHTLGLDLQPSDKLDRLDVTIDGTDQVLAALIRVPTSKTRPRGRGTSAKAPAPGAYFERRRSPRNASYSAHFDATGQRVVNPARRRA